MTTTHHPATLTRRRRPGSRFRRSVRLVSLMLTALALALAGLVAPTAAHADPYPSADVQVGANIRSCASTACSSYGTVGRDSDFTGTQRSWVECYADGGWATGNYSSNRWFLVYVHAYASSYAFWGYVHASYVYNQPTVVRC